VEPCAKCIKVLEEGRCKERIKTKVIHGFKITKFKSVYECIREKELESVLIVNISFTKFLE
jgi:hypothetical protein